MTGMIRHFRLQGRRDRYWSLLLAAPLLMTSSLTPAVATSRMHFSKLATLDRPMKRTRLRIPWPLTNPRVAKRMNSTRPYDTRIGAQSVGECCEEEPEENEKRRRDANKLIDIFLVPGLTYEEFKDRNPKPAKGTFQWFHQNHKARTWREEGQNLMVIEALPGQGKSVLARSLVDSWCAENQSAVCHFFFKETNEIQRSAAMGLCAILHQILSMEWPLVLIPEIRDLIEQQRDGLAGSLTDLWAILELCAAHSERGPIVCVLDGLDECDESSRDLLLRKVVDHCAPECASHTAAANKIKFLFTTRPVPQVMNSLHTAPTVVINPKDKLGLLIADIHRVVDLGIQHLALAPTTSWDDALCEDIKNELKKGKEPSQNTYLWLVLVFEVLGRNHTLSRHDWVPVVRGLSQSLDDVYEHILSRVRPDSETVVRQLLKVMIAAVRPLGVEEMNIALGVSFKRRLRYMKSDTHFADWVEESCFPFVHIQDNTVQFIHQTAKEFLISGPKQGADWIDSWQGSFPEHKAHREMRNLCSIYLGLRAERWRDGYESSEGDADCSSKFHLRFLVYCLEKGEIHHRLCGDKTEFESDVIFSVPNPGGSRTVVPLARIIPKLTEDPVQTIAQIAGHHMVYRHLESLVDSGDDRWSSIKIPRLYNIAVLKDSRRHYRIVEYAGAECITAFCPDDTARERIRQIAKVLVFLLSIKLLSPMGTKDSESSRNYVFLGDLSEGAFRIRQDPDNIVPASLDSLLVGDASLVAYILEHSKENGWPWNLLYDEVVRLLPEMGVSLPPSDEAILMEGRSAKDQPFCESDVDDAQRRFGAYFNENGWNIE